VVSPLHSDLVRICGRVAADEREPGSVVCAGIVSGVGSLADPNVWQRSIWFQFVAEKGHNQHGLAIWASSG
jgi:hypothetical protein